jgi:ferrochelatase
VPCQSRSHPVAFAVTKRNANGSYCRFGFVAFAEIWNGRLAMLGFVIGLGTELLTGQGILSQIGLG